jgi:uncharacterized membrane protein
MNGLTLPRGWTLPRLSFGGVIPLATGALMAAGAIHIGTILLVPFFAQGDGWSRLAPYAGSDKFAEVPVTAEAGVAGLDPLFVNGACRLNLTDAPAGITVDARDRFWSVALYDPAGAILFSLNDRTAVQGKLDMIVVSAAQNAALRRASTAEIELSVVVESPSDDLIALLRLFAPTRAAREDARQVMARAECLPAPSVMPQPSGG